MDRLPRRLAVVGTGIVGCEYASTFAALGIELTLFGRRRILSFLDGEIVEHLRKRMAHHGIRLRLGVNITGYELLPDSVRLVLPSGETLEVDKVLVATGRTGNTDDLALERAGITPLPQGLLKVNEHYQTEVPHIYAAGDVIGFPALAEVSMEQARVAVCHAFDLRYKTRVAAVLPLAVYTIPEVAMAGETEESCREKGLPYCVGRAFYSGNARGQIMGDQGGVIKLIFTPDGQRLLGVHVVGDDASELIHVGMACMTLGGGLDYFIQAVFNYPTLAEAYKYAAYDGLQNIARLEARPPRAAEDLPRTRVPPGAVLTGRPIFAYHRAHDRRADRPRRRGSGRAGSDPAPAPARAGSVPRGAGRRAGRRPGLGPAPAAPGHRVGLQRHPFRSVASPGARPSRPRRWPRPADGLPWPGRAAQLLGHVVSALS